MRKTTLFISATLTTFILAVLAGVAKAYQTAAIPIAQEVQAQAEEVQAQTEDTPISDQPVVVTPQPVNLTPEQAADLASQIMGDTDLFSVEVTQFNGETVYLITFSSGDLVYMSLDGSILSIDKLDVVVVNVPSDNNGKNNKGTKPRHDDDHEDDHEGHDDD
jgi:hypothetical protein